MRSIKPRCENRDVHKIFEFFILKVFNDLIPGSDIGIADNKSCFSFRKIGKNFFSMFHTGAEDHDTLAVKSAGDINNVIYDKRSETFLVFQKLFNFRVRVHPVFLSELREIITGDGNINFHRLREKFILNHVRKRKLKNALAEKPRLIRFQFTHVGVFVNPSHAHAIRSGSQTQDAEIRITRPEFLDHFLILGGTFFSYAVTFINNKKRKIPEEFIGCPGHGLNTAKNCFLIEIFFSQAGGEDSRFETITRIFGVILLHQFFDVGKNQNTTFGDFSELSNDETFPGTGRQNYECRLAALFEIINSVSDGFLLIWA